MRFVRLMRYPQGIRAYFLESPLLRSGIRVLDAGCGSGIVTLALREALLIRGFRPGHFQGFDLTPAMLQRFRHSLRAQAIEDIEIVQANVLELERLPTSWSNYDLIVSASMLEYVTRDRFVATLSGLHALLNDKGRFVLFSTRENSIMRQLIGLVAVELLHRARTEGIVLVGRLLRRRISEVPTCLPLPRFLGLYRRSAKVGIALAPDLSASFSYTCACDKLSPCERLIEVWNVSLSAHSKVDK